MKMLAAGGVPPLTDGVRSADDANPLGYFEFEAVKTLGTGAATDWLATACGQAVKIVSPLLTHLPESYEYQVVFMRRDLDEVLASQNAMLEARRQPQGAPDAQLRAYYEEHLQQVERFLARRACFSTLMVQYADVLARPRDESSRIDEFVGGGLDVAKMAAVVDPALYRHSRG